jgi:hypothetical protein
MVVPTVGFSAPPVPTATPTPATATATPRSGVPSPKLEELQRQVEALTHQLEQVQSELADLKQNQQQELQQNETARLRQAAAAAAASTAPAEIDTTTSFVSGTRMQPQLNPEISLTGTMYALGGSNEQERFSVGEWELDIQSYLDPYAKVHVVLAKPENESLDLEEGYVTWLGLPGHTALTVGKKRQQFGVLNRLHPHAYDQVDAPLVLTETFGEEGLAGTGLSVDWNMPPLWADANELTVEVMNGDNDVAFAGESWEHPSLLARLKNYWDVTPDSYFELGLNGLHGNADSDGHLDHDIYALDLTYNWYPAGRELYREVTLRGMLLYSDLALDTSSSREAWGGYVYGQLKLSPRWITGIRYDYVEDQREDGHSYWGVSPYLTMWQSEFVRLRGQLDYLDDNLAGVDRRFVLQLTVAAGPHKHDSY